MYGVAVKYADLALLQNHVDGAGFVNLVDSGDLSFGVAG